jgi:hypothetical protein
MLTTRVKYELAGGAVGLVVIVLVVASWVGAREDAVRAKATVDAQQTIIAAAEKNAKTLLDAETARDQLTAVNVAALQASAAKQVTPAQIAAWIPKQLQQLPGTPITLSIPAATAQNPTPDAIASIPQADLPILRDQLEKCQECGVKLAAVQQDATSKDQRLLLAGQQLSAVSVERDAYKQAAKGGPFWSRVKSKAKWFAIGGAVVAGALCGTGHCK